MNYLDIATRAVAVYVLMLIWSRLLGRKLISHMKFFDFVTGITIGSIGGSLIFSKGIGLGKGLFGLSIFCGLAIVSGLLSLKSYRARMAIDSQPVIVIREGNILNGEMTKLRLTYNDLLVLLRKKGIFYLDEVQLAIFETDGTLSIQRKSELMPVSKKDMKINSQSRGLSQTFIIDGKVIDNELQVMNKDIKWLEALLIQRQIRSINDITLAQMDQLGNIFFDLRDHPLH